MILFLLILFFLLTPFYFFESGGLQPSHISFVILFLYYFLYVKKLKLSMPYKARKAVLYLILFITYVFATNFTASIIYNGEILPKHSFYYLFNFLVFILFLDLFEYKKEYTSVIFNLLTMTLIIQLLLMISGYGRTWHGQQHILFFNNPNQLGYFSLLLSSVLIIIGINNKKHPLIIMILVIISAYLSLSAVSITASIAITVSAIIYYINQMRKKTKTFYIIILISIIVATTYGNTFYKKISNEDIFTRIDHKFNNKTTRDGGWAAGRGYDTLTENPEYLLFGRGELPGQFHTEFHSIFGNILRSYGFVGLFLFLNFGYRSFKNSPISIMYYLIPVLIYGISHNGIRQPFLWLFLATIVSLFKKQDGNFTPP